MVRLISESGFGEKLYTLWVITRRFIHGGINGGRAHSIPGHLTVVAHPVLPYADEQVAVGVMETESRSRFDGHLAILNAECSVIELV